MARCCLLLNDQLSHDLPSLQVLEADDVVLMTEVWSEVTYVKHHKQKIVLWLSAMRHFAAELKASGRTIIYVRLDDPLNSQTLGGEIERIHSEHQFDGWVMTEASEWRLADEFRRLQIRLPVPLEIFSDSRFLTSHDEFAQFLEGRKQPRMEHFYRKIRQKTGILMDGRDPVGGKWNFDHDNRKAFSGGNTPTPPSWSNDRITTDVIKMVESKCADHFGSIEQLSWTVNRLQALEIWAHFLTERLPYFGDYQDALVAQNDTMFHSLISTSLNIGLLSVTELCRDAELEFREGRSPINAVEGFIRQVIGWREYVRGLYWAYMPEYKTRNALQASWPLPEFFWNEDLTDMRCIREAIRNTRENSYAHHIQRLMVTGNFALIFGCSVDQVTDWYLAVYADAYEWVELPNTLGMALYADGGLLGSKPYCASGKYIDRMSDYCRGCAYSVKETVGDNACPLNYLYWDFLKSHEERFRNNPRMAMIMKNLDRMSDEKIVAVTQAAAEFRSRVEATGSDRIAGVHASLI